MAKFPHMKEGESEIWERFLENLPWRPTRIEYDVRLGEGAMLPEGTPDWVRDMAFALSTKRVDVVVTTTARIYIVEVKVRASLSAVGQLLGYEVLYRRQFGAGPGLTLVLVAEVVAPDVQPVLDRYGIELHMV